MSTNRLNLVLIVQKIMKASQRGLCLTKSIHSHASGIRFFWKVEYIDGVEIDRGNIIIGGTLLFSLLKAVQIKITVQFNIWLL